jgi:hypothetical protein
VATNIDHCGDNQCGTSVPVEDPEGTAFVDADRRDAGFTDAGFTDAGLDGEASNDRKSPRA